MNLPAGTAKKAYVTRMFTGLSENYDLVNSICSLFIDHTWRIRAVRALGKASRGLVLDLCAGTLPLSFAFLKRARGTIVAVDISEGMLRTGIRALHRKYRPDRLGAVCGDGELLPLKNQTCDGAMVAFGIRNLADLDKGFRDVYRVMRPGARLVILEFSRPGNPLLAFPYRLYLKWILVPVGTLLTGDRDAYQYLVKSIEAFPAPEEVAGKLRKTGFSNISVIPLTGGIVTLYTAERI
ncbi:MAG: ubiquinone/menaquinone biosynthesis methyltransferase [Deltaproteobacteria bacterium]|nr:ubiquinone/menaquinone biosynthesis methyltransferase [Deltaproteobacteria bacterium]